MTAAPREKLPKSWDEIMRKQGRTPAQTGAPKEEKAGPAQPLPATPAAPAAPPKPGEAAPLPATPPAAGGDDSWTPDFMKPGAMWSKETEETVMDTGRAALDRFTGGFLPFVGNKMNELSGKGQSPYEAAVNAERRSPIATAAGDVAGTAAQYFPVVGALNRLPGMAAPVARTLAGILPASAETFIKEKLGDAPPPTGNDVVGDAARGVAAAAPSLLEPTAPFRAGARAVQGMLPFTGAIPGVGPVLRSAARMPNLIPKPVIEGLSALAPGLLEANLQHEGPPGPGGTERELTLERERKRRQEKASPSGR